MEKMVEMWRDKLKASIDENKTVKVYNQSLICRASGDNITLNLQFIPYLP